MTASLSRRVIRIGLRLIGLAVIVALSVPALRIDPVPSPAHAQDPCNGLVEPRLTVGGAGRVVSGYGVKLKNRPYTSAGGATDLATLPFGTVMTVIGEHQCNYGFVWWEVQLPDGTKGWSAEGSDTEYFIEPYTIGLHTYRPRDEGAQIVRYFVTPDALAQGQIVFNVAPVSTTPVENWQRVEIDYLIQALDSTLELCPERLTGTVWEGIQSVDEAMQLPLPALDYDYYPSPDGSHVLLVRHLTLELPRCDTVIPEKVGMHSVSVLDADGNETQLFPYAQHGPVPASVDRYAISEQDAPPTYLSEIVWSPHGKYIAFVAAYRDLCQGQACYRFHIYVWNMETGQLYILGEGRHVGWASGGDRLNFFRLIVGADGLQSPHLYNARPDGTDRQEIWLPGGAVYVSDKQTPLDFPWNEGGTRVMVGNAGVAEVMLFNLADRDFSPPIPVPDLMPQVNRLAVHLIQGEGTIFWATIRGEFVTQAVQSGAWTQLTSEVASLGVAPVHVQPFGNGRHVLIDMADGTAYLLDIVADTLTQVMVKR